MEKKSVNHLIQLFQEDLNINLMKKVLVIFLFFISSCQEEKIEYLFIDKIDINEKIENPSLVINDKEQFVHFFSENHEHLFRLKKYIDFEKYDLESFDYILTFSKELIDLNTTDDECDYLSKTPVKATYKEKEMSEFIYIYKILSKNKYRNLCP